MTVAFQGSLLDGGPSVDVGTLGASVHRRQLTDGAWVDVRRRWIAGADTLFERLQQTVPWHAERRPMYDKVVDVPRLLSFYDEDDDLPDPTLMTAKRVLDRHYRAELGESFATAGLCLYRDGRDSVAWHGDRIDRSIEDPVVALVSFGEPRKFLLRPKGGGASRTFPLGAGDLLVTGGRTQRDWDHSVPKVAKAGPRISLAYRHGMDPAAYAGKRVET
jgi:alkylated DNA repair dioxygenase AlkB